MKKLFTLLILGILLVSIVSAEQFIDRTYTAQSGAVLGTNQVTGDFQFIPSGYNNINLKFTNKAGIVYNIALLGNDGNGYRIGRYSGSTWYPTHVQSIQTISDEDSFIVSKNGYTRILQFKEVMPGSNTTDNSGTIRVKDSGSGDMYSVSYTNLEGILTLDGNTYIIRPSVDAISATLLVEELSDILYSSSGKTLSFVQSADFLLQIDGNKVDLVYTDSQGSSKDTVLFCWNSANQASNVCGQKSSCSDTDKGKDYYHLGSITTEQGIFTDSCETSKSLKEWYCDEANNNGYDFIQQTCPFDCENGVCKAFEECDLISILKEGETQTYTLSNKNPLTGKNWQYEIKLGYADESKALFIVNGQTLPSLNILDERPSSSGISVKLLSTMKEGIYRWATFCLEEHETITCTDSDNGKDYSVKGSATLANIDTKYDACESNKLKEVYCENNEIKTAEYTCPNGCSEGKCLPLANVTVEVQKVCVDTDDGKNYYTKGFVTSTDTGTIEDLCINGIVLEAYCDGNIGHTIKYACTFGCSEGACKKELKKEITIEPQPATTSVQPATPVQADKCKGDAECDDKNACTWDLCAGTPKTCSHQKKDGCDYGDKCLPISIRAGDKYCDVDGEMKRQIAGESACENNYECLTNVCIDGKCLAQGIFRKILNWFMAWFS